MQTTISSSISHENAILGLAMPETREPDISSQAHLDSLMTQALTIAHNAPDVRRDRVEAIRAQIESGEYEIDADRIAESLIRENPALFEE